MWSMSILDSDKPNAMKTASRTALRFVGVGRSVIEDMSALDVRYLPQYGTGYSGLDQWVNSKADRDDQVSQREGKGTGSGAVQKSAGTEADFKWFKNPSTILLTACRSIPSNVIEKSISMELCRHKSKRSACDIST